MKKSEIIIISFGSIIIVAIIIAAIYKAKFKRVENVTETKEPFIGTIIDLFIKNPAGNTEIAVGGQIV